MTEIDDIPDFLRGPRTPIEPRRRRRVKPKRPDCERWRTAQLTRVYLYDEAPTIGCGERLVWVAEGRRWCKLCCLAGHKARITMAAWAQIASRRSVRERRSPASGV